MFLATALLYPCALAALCLSAGLLVDRLSGRFLPAHLLASVGAAALIALSQLTTFIPAIATATPYAIAVLALAGLILARRRAQALALRALGRPLLLAGPVLAYLLALAPVLLAGRTTFSSFMALSDSAVHMMGADYLIEHGQSYSHLDLSNSYGRFIDLYYNSSYPSGADTLFGGSAALLGLPLIWAFQPFNAFMLATAYGPALLLARRLRLAGGWAEAAALTSVLPALVYGYELLGSVKEVTALPMLLCSGCLVALHPRWMRRQPGGGLPLALVLAAGISALGVAFGVWALAAVAVLALALANEIRARRLAPPHALALVAIAVTCGVIAALPTWSDLSGSLQVANSIASTANPGNLHAPLRAVQALGIWLGGSYKQQPTGTALQITHGLIALALLAVMLGAVHVLLSRERALAAWIALVLLAWLIVSRSVATWASAKTLMLTSPVVLLLAWAGVAAVKALPPRAPATAAAALLASALLGGVLVSDTLQYRSSNLAPTTRYEELASLDSRFATAGPALFTDFDEYALYELRRLDIGAPNFVYPPPALAAAAGGYGRQVDLSRVAPAALVGYPLIITRRDPSTARPPAAYRLAWQGDYYEVWRRTPGAAPALAQVALDGAPAAQCARIERLAAAAGPRARRLLAAASPQIVGVALARSSHPARWGHQRGALVMSRAGRLSAAFRLPAGGDWNVWLQGEFMPTVHLALDGRPLASIGAELSGNSLVRNTLPPIAVRLGAGRHSVSVVRSGATLQPGDGGSAVLAAIFLTPAAADPEGALLGAAVTRAQALCGRGYRWVELLAG
jgi:hypothetical protein